MERIPGGHVGSASGSGGVGGAGGLPPDRPHNNTQNGARITHARAEQLDLRPVVAMVPSQNGGMERGVIFPAGSGHEMRVRNPEALNGFRLGTLLPPVLIDNHNVPYLIHPFLDLTTGQIVRAVNPLAPIPRAIEAVRACRARRAAPQPETTQRQSRSTTQQQGVPPGPRRTQPPAPHNSPLGALIPDVVHELGSHLSKTDLDSLSQVNRHHYNALAQRRDAIRWGVLLAQGQATITDDIIRRTPAVTGPAQFDMALQYIQGLPVEHQREPLQALVRNATTRGQFERVYDHLHTTGLLPVGLIDQLVPAPPNFGALTPGSQRSVNIFRWRLTATVMGSTLSSPLRPQRRQELINAYAAFLQGIDGMVLPDEAIEDITPRNSRTPQVLQVFGAPEGMDIDAGVLWLQTEAQLGNLQLTEQLHDRLPVSIRHEIQHAIPGYRFDMIASSNYVNTFNPMFRLGPPQI